MEVVRDVIQDMPVFRRGDLKITPIALAALQKATEAFLVSYLKDRRFSLK